MMIQAPQKKKILFVAEAVTLAHVARPLALAETLDQNLYEIFFACSPKFHWLLKNKNFNILSLKSVDSEEFLHRVKNIKPVFTEDELNAHVREDLFLIAQVNPEFVVGDFRLSLSISTRLKKIPYANITNFHWSPFSKMKLSAPDILPVRIFGQKISDLFFPLISPFFSRLHAKPINNVRKKYGLPLLKEDVREIYADGDYVLYADFPHLIPRSKLPPHHLFLGPINWSLPTREPDWWTTFPRSLPIVYVNLGSSGNKKDLPVILESLGSLPVIVIATTAGMKLNQNVLSHLGKNIFISEFLPHEKCLKISQLAILNGGSSSSYSALIHGIPVIGVTHIMDQESSMNAIEGCGAGIHLRSRSLNKNRIQKAVREVLKNPRYKTAVNRIINNSYPYDPSKIFPKFVSQILDVMEKSHA